MVTSWVRSPGLSRKTGKCHHLPLGSTRWRGYHHHADTMFLGWSSVDSSELYDLKCWSQDSSQVDKNTELSINWQKRWLLCLGSTGSRSSWSGRPWRSLHPYRCGLSLSRGRTRLSTTTTSPEKVLLTHQQPDGSSNNIIWIGFQEVT